LGDKKDRFGNFTSNFAEQWNAMTDLQKEEYKNDPTKFSKEI
jgi:hypothetical protein